MLFNKSRRYDSLPSAPFITILFYLFPGLITCITGCIGTSQIITGQPLAPTLPSRIEIYASPPPRFKEIAVIEASRTSVGYGEKPKTSDQLINKMKLIAASVGANGILIRRLSNNSASRGTSYGLSSSYGASTHNMATNNTDSLHGIAIFVVEEK
jgi:hypothetical protein